MSYTRLAVGFIVRFREHRNDKGSLIGGPFVHVGRVDYPGLRRFPSGGGFSLALRRRHSQYEPEDVSWYGVAIKYRGWRRPNVEFAA